MKKRGFLIIATLFLIVMALGIHVFLKRHYLQEGIVQAIERSMDAKVSVSAVAWRWFPAPAITITQLRAESEALTLVVPKVHLIVSPTFFLSQSVSLFRAKLIDPDLIITKLETENSLLKKNLPQGTIFIDNGTLHLPTQRLTQTVAIKPTSVTGINGTVSAHAAGAAFTISACSNFAQWLHLNGTIAYPEGTYQMDIAAAGFDSDSLISNQLPTPSLPIISNMTFTSHLEGQGADRSTLRLTSKEAPFTVEEQNLTATVTALDCVLTRSNTDYAIAINKLSLSDPAMVLSGQVSRQENITGGTPTPQWHIDVHGADIDLAAVRTSLLQRFPSHPLAQKVCGIVKGGSATTARYLFSGETSDFHHLHAMQIWAEAKDVPVVIPGVKLAIDRASGPISIIDSQLTGENLSADIDKSHGENGKLLVDLRHDQHTFMLDLDLTADLRNLKEVLTQVVRSSKFQEELRQFSAVKGLAKGHLHLGDDLHHIKTHVDVISMQAQGTYDRLPWPFTINAGNLTVAPQQVEWRQVQGSVGKQRINNAQGSVDWYDGIAVNIDALSADLDLEPLFDKGALTVGSGKLSIQNLFQGKLDDLAGTASIDNASFWGRIGQKEAWRFNTKLSSSDLMFTGPALPKVTSPSVQSEISHNQLRVVGIFSLLNDQLFLDGRYAHQLFDRWHGDLTVNGNIGQQLGEWIQERPVMLSAPLPTTPFRLEQFTVSTPGTSADPLIARGSIISLVKDSQARLELDISRHKDRTSERLTFVDGSHSGTLSYLTLPEEDQSLLTWQGELNVKTFDDLFLQHFFQEGSVQGAFTRLAKKGSVSYNGEVQLNAISFGSQGLPSELTIDSLHLSGDAQDVFIAKGDLTLDKSQSRISGKLSEVKGVRTLDLNLTAPSLSSTVLNTTAASIKKLKNTHQGSSFRQSIKGKVSFNIDKFDYTRIIPSEQNAAGEERLHVLSIAPFFGQIAISPDAADLTFDSSRVCGLAIQGTWHLNNETVDNEVSFTSGRSPLYFETALPCLGFKQSLIAGPFVIDGELSGRPQNWQQGTIALSSQEGLIKRMNLLSEIFTAVNFIDYFTWQDMPNLDEEGLAFNELTLNAHIENNILTLDKTSIKGKGVNLTGRGSINLASYNSDLTFFIAPFKMVDSIVTGIPFIGKALGGAKESILTFPVKVTGNISSPEVTALAPEALGTAAWELLRDTLTLPYRIIQPAEK